MPDITMCFGKGCTIKDQCYRHTARSSDPYQAWFMEQPGQDENCEYFWPNDGTPAESKDGTATKTDLAR